MRIEKTIAFMESIKPEDIAGHEDRPVSLPYFSQPMNAFGYATEYLLPNFYFHVTTAYSILRKNGVVIGKTDKVLTVQTQTESVFVAKDDIDEIRPTDASLMPEGLEAALTPQSLADLIAYLKMAR